MAKLVPFALAFMVTSCNQGPTPTSMDCSKQEARIADLELEFKIRERVAERVAELEGRIAKAVPVNQWSQDFDYDMDDSGLRVIMRNQLTSDRDSPALEIVCEDGKFNILLFLGGGQEVPSGGYGILLKYRKSKGPKDTLTITDKVVLELTAPTARFILPERSMDAILAYETLKVVLLHEDSAPPKFEGTFNLNGLEKRLATRDPLGTDNVCGI